MDYKFTFPDIVRERGLTASRVAAIVGISRQAVYSLIRPGATQIRFDTINKICSGFGVTPADLFTPKESNPGD